MSLGGNGGLGGASISGTVVSQGRVDVTIGGGGGTGGTGKTVTAESTGAVTTSGTNAPGILAQSKGGNGGAGGWAAEGGITVSPDGGSVAGDLAVSLGGSGASGGTGGKVTITNAGEVTTENFGATALIAQSQGGQGGVGGAVYTGQINAGTKYDADVEIALGGKGGSGGKADDVIVTNASGAEVETSGANSDAIFAQSLGGDGGKGGSSYNVLMNVKPQNASGATFRLTVGGAGGGGSTPGTATVDNFGTLTTSGLDSNGIQAQAIGGNGGAGGAGGNMLFNFAQGKQNTEDTYNFGLTFAIGGGGGTGADANDVAVTNHSGGNITTNEDSSHGIMAHSVGGGGGNGGSASGYTFNYNGVCSLVPLGSGWINKCNPASQPNNTTNMSASMTLTLGGSGGAAGDGATVTATNSGSLETRGDASHGIFAQSIGGGGGTGGSGTTGIGAFTSNKVAGDIAAIVSDATKWKVATLKSFTNVTMSIGGTGGAAGTGEAVSVTNDGGITTAGSASYGILAQSIGGGGGAGGFTTSSPVWSLRVGGSGGGGGDAGTVQVDLGDWSHIATTGDAAMGVLAQSIGGGGGAVNHKHDPTGNPQLNIRIGGAEGVSGDGGPVTVQTTVAGGSLTTQTAESPGIFAQSIGAGGGISQGGLDNATGAVSVAGSGKSAGNGDDVKVSYTGSIKTAQSVTSVSLDDAAHAVFAQSVGGGGGYGGSVVMGPTTRFGTGLPISTDTTASGDGGSVNVDLSGAIDTIGGSSVGIFAQSVGGGGGVAGAADSRDEMGAYLGNGGGTGSGGAVSITFGADQAGSKLTTSGAGAHGIFAQSVGGPGTATTTDTQVNVTVDGVVAVSGAGAHGVFAQSAGAGKGAIEITVNEDASVQGGGNASVVDAEDGAGIFVLGGTTATLTNYGTITSVLGADGIAVANSDANLHIRNYGTITGSHPAASSTTLDNRPGGLLQTGAFLEIDRLVNRGVLAVDPGRVGATRHTGDLVQHSEGELRFDLDPRRLRAPSGDVLTIDGDAFLAGSLRVRILDPWQPVERRSGVEFIRVSGNLDSHELEIVPSVVAQYEAVRSNPGSFGASYHIDFANDTVLAATNDNQDSTATHVHGLYRARALDTDIALSLIAFEETRDYVRAINSLGGEVAVDNQIATLDSAMRFGDAILGCAERSGDNRLFDNGNCAWFNIGGTSADHDATSDSLGFGVRSWRVSGGAQTRLDDDWTIGGGVSYEYRNLSVNDSDVDSDGGLFQAGLTAERQFGATEISGFVSLGYGRFDTDRTPLPGVSLGGTQDQWIYSGRLRAARLFEAKDLTFKPRVDLGVHHLVMNGTDETGDDGIGISFDKSRNTLFYVQPAVETAYEFELDDGVLVRPRLTVGVTQFLGDKSVSVDGRLIGAPSDLGTFGASTEVDRTRIDVAAAADLFTRDGLTVRAVAAGGFSKNVQSYGASLKLEIPF